MIDRYTSGPSAVRAPPAAASVAGACAPAPRPHPAPQAVATPLNWAAGPTREKPLWRSMPQPPEYRWAP